MTMQHPFSVLRGEYEALLGSMKITRAADVELVAHRILQPSSLSRYQEVATATKVPATLIAALDYRESDCDPKSALGQGDPWNKVSTHVPRGHGPFSSWMDAAEFYVRYDHLDELSVAFWSMAYVCWKAEAWNGFGPRNHGIHTGYLWAGTNHYSAGKYVADGVWKASFVDKQIGVIPLIARIGEIVPTLKIADFALPNVTAPATPLAAPVGVSGGVRDTRWLQIAINYAFLKPRDEDLLLVDGSYGRRTRAAVREFQAANGLEQDGLFGPKTEAALLRALGERK